MRMPKSFLVKKKEDLIVHINYTEEMEIIQKRMERQLDALDIKIPTVLPEKVLPKSSPLKEKDSLHKFAIAKMLGITEDDVPQSKKAKTERLDENCNRVVPNSSHTDRAFDLSLKPSEGIAMVDPATKHMRGMDAKVSQRSPNGSPSEPPKMFEPFPWPHPMLHPHPHAFPPFIPFGMRYANMHATFPYPSLADNCFGYKPFPEHLVAMKALLTPPQTRFPQGPLIPLSPQNSDKVIEGSRSDSNFQGKLINSAFDPVISSYSVFTPEKHSMDLGGKKKERELEPTRYHCDGCSKVYATFSGLSKHKQFHCASQVKKEFSCKYCEKTYVSLGALKMHIRTHTLPCKCKLCGKAFSRPWLLQGHIRTHTGEKPFRCDHCARAFADRSNLRAHLQTHSDIKKYSCKACSKTFSRMSLLLKHEDNCCAGHTVT